MSTPQRRQYARRQVDDLLRDAAWYLSSSRSAFWQLVNAVRASSTLLSPCVNRGHTNPTFVAAVVSACQRMAVRHTQWERQPESWSTAETNPMPQFRSLVNHLFDRYETPRFMTSVWLDESCNPWELLLYLHLAQGQSIRRFPSPGLPPLTKKAGAFLMQAPDHFSLFNACQWARFRALGANSRLARLLVKQLALHDAFGSFEFQDSVVRFLLKEQPICETEVIDILNFIHEQRFQPARKVWGPGAGNQPLQPDFCLKGRSLMSLRRHMANWRADLLPKLPSLLPDNPGWTPSDIQPFRHQEGETIWTIDELLTDKELRVEGGIMQHCVGTYVQECAGRHTTIWSMKRHRGEQRKRVLTIEVLPECRTVWQAQGKRNSYPTAEAKAILRQWAKRESLCCRSGIANYAE